VSGAEDRAAVRRDYVAELAGQLYMQATAFVLEPAVRAYRAEEMGEKLVALSQKMLIDSVNTADDLWCKAEAKAGSEGDPEAIHGFFELSYASYLVLPRSVLQSMPPAWQRAFVALLRELDETIDWRPKAGLHYEVVLVRNTDRLEEDGPDPEPQLRFMVPDPLLDYERGRRRVPHREGGRGE